MAGGVDVGKTLVVFERDRAGGNVEDEGAKGAVVVLPAAIDFKIVPAEVFDGCFEILLGEGIGRIFGDQRNFAIGRDPGVAKRQVCGFYSIKKDAVAPLAHSQLLSHRDLSYSMAKTIAETAIYSCAAKGYAVSAVVVDRRPARSLSRCGDTSGRMIGDAGEHVGDIVLRLRPLSLALSIKE